MNSIIFIFIVLALLRWLGICLLEVLNTRYAARQLRKQAERENEAEVLNKTLEYSEAKSRLILLETSVSTIILITVILGKILPWLYEQTTRVIGFSVWSDALYLFGLAVLAGILSLPFDWYRQFRLEERFGFNTNTQFLWWSDRFKILLLTFVLLYPLTVLILYLVKISGEAWWILTWVTLILFQLLMFLIAPKLILPLFNKFSPLQDESLKVSIREAANKAGFEFESIEVMDGSKRSTHSNAFFTGLGKSKKIALFDTILGQLTEPEITAVLAHEIGHYKKGHIPKLIALSSLILLIELFIVSLLIGQDWLIAPFGFTPGRFATDILVIALFSSLITFWLSPFENWFSRKFEYEADNFSAKLIEDYRPMAHALEKLQTSNLSNPFPHPAYSFFYYSHPTVRERVRNLRGESLPE